MDGPENVIEGKRVASSGFAAWQPLRAFAFEDKGLLVSFLPSICRLFFPFAVTVRETLANSLRVCRVMIIPVSNYVELALFLVAGEFYNRKIISPSH
jgi:hypothetical protein